MTAPTDHLKALIDIDRLVFEPPQTLVPGLAMLGWSQQQTARPRGLGRHCHPEAYELCLIAAGQVHWLTDQHTMTLGRNHLLITPPGQPHGGLDNVMHPCQLFWLQVDIDRITGHLPGTRTAEQWHEDLNRPPAIRHCPAHTHSRFEQLINLHRNPHPLNQTTAPALLSLLLADFILATDEPTEIPGNVQKAIDTIRNNPTDEYSIEKLMDLTALSESTLRQKFISATGLSPMDFVQHRRIELARQWLVSTEQSITQIAHRLGYHSSQYFATVFKKQTGLTPSQCRQQDHPAPNAGQKTPKGRWQL